MEVLELYRYLDCKSRVDEGPPTIVLKRFPIHGETARCWKIQVDGQEMKVLKGDGKRFAHEQLAWAIYSWRRRKSFQLGHLRRQLAHVEKCVQVLDEELPQLEHFPDWKVVLGDPGETRSMVDRLRSTEASSDPYDLEF